MYVTLEFFPQSEADSQNSSHKTGKFSLQQAADSHHDFDEPIDINKIK